MHEDRPHSFAEALRVSCRILSSSEELARKGLAAPESELIVCAAYRASTGQALSRLELYARAADRLPEAVADQVLIYSHLRAGGKLLQHITGTQAFLDHEYRVTPDVLVPRPETEQLAVFAIGILSQAGAPSPSLGLEVGLGSGILSIELLHRFPSLHMRATELSPAALAIALQNARDILGAGAGAGAGQGKGLGAARLTVERVEDPAQVLEPFIASPCGADFLISNPPYLVAASAEAEREVSEQEPAQALFAPAHDPVYFYRKMAEQGRSVLRPGGRIFVELAAERADEIRGLFRAQGWVVETHPDLNGRERILYARDGDS